MNITKQIRQPARLQRLEPQARRVDILAGATGVFMTYGFGGRAMSGVARRLGGSKATLYRHFRSKQELVAAVVREGAARQGRLMVLDFAESSDLAFDLRRLGRGALSFEGSEEYLALRRAVIAEADRSDFGNLHLEPERRAALKPLAERFVKAMQRGILRRASPMTAALQFRALCHARHGDPRLDRVVEELSPGEIARAADEAVDILLRAYELRRRAEAEERSTAQAETAGRGGGDKT